MSSNSNYSIDMLLKSAFVYEILNELKYTNADTSDPAVVVTKNVIKIYLENKIKEIDSRYKDM
jgi:hypothetical protein